MFPESAYKIPFFLENDFVRKKCKHCDSYFWTQNSDLDNCGDAPCQEYTFIGNPPTKRSFTFEELREAFLSFFEKNSHTRINPYPVIARWRDDLFITIASIANFQPFVTEGLIPPPANPLVITQPCLRFNDIDNVGLTAGRHLTIFEMGGAHAFNYPKKQVYWKNQTLTLHHKFLTDVLGINSSLVTYKEGIWSGGGNAGPDVEGCVCGLEVSTLVFMQYKVVGNELIDMPIKIVDTGYGIERFCWLSQGSLSGFHALYGSLLDKILNLSGLNNIDKKFLFESSKLSAIMNSEFVPDRMSLRKRVAKKLDMNYYELDRFMVPIESAYAIADHTKALIFMLAEGVVPSNTNEGYLIRLLMRRVYKLLSLIGIESYFFEIINEQIDRWVPSFPYIKSMQTEILDALSVEVKKYQLTLKRGIGLSKRIARKLKLTGKHEVPLKTLVELYDSHGIPPEIVKDVLQTEDMTLHIPDNFYAMIAKSHISPTFLKEDFDDVSKLKDKVSEIKKTRQLYFENSYLKKFKAVVLKVIDKRFIVLDKTAFYPESGGQQSDSGSINIDGKQVDVINVQKVGNIILHEINAKVSFKSKEITGKINWDKRLNLMRHHTSTHILLGAVRKVLGEHAWQAGSRNEISISRLDVSHWARITKEQEMKIERLANSIVMQNIPVEVSLMPREVAEKTYGYRLYQGGIIPDRQIRIVRIGNWDVEACGGTHLKSTGELGLIKILHTERIQDGVERITFASGFPAIQFTQDLNTHLSKSSKILNVPKEKIIEATEDIIVKLKSANRKILQLKERLAKFQATLLLKKTQKIKNVIIITNEIEDSDVDFLIKTASFITKKEPNTVVALCTSDETLKIVVMAGDEAVKSGVNAGQIVSKMAKVVGGGGSGGISFGQGGGIKLEKVSEALSLATETIINQVTKVNP
jgi:alanyl-tRNA synthetase